MERDTWKSELQKQLIAGAVVLCVAALAVWVQYRAAEEMSTGGWAGRIAFWRREVERRQTEEDQFRKAANRMLFEAYSIVTEAKEA